MVIARNPNRNGTSGLVPPREKRRVDHQKCVIHVNAISPAGHPDASYHRVKPETGTATATMIAALRRAPYSRASRKTPAARIARISIITTNAARDRLSNRDTRRKFAQLSGFQIPSNPSAA